MPSQTEFTPGFRFKDGKLMIFRGHEVIVIQGWPEPGAVRKMEGERFWNGFVPEFRLVKPYRPSKPRKRKAEAAGDDGQLGFDFGKDFAASVRPELRKPGKTQERKRAFDSFRFSLPREVARVLEPFPSHQWPLLMLLAHDGAALELAQSNPVLAYGLAQHLGCDAKIIAGMRFSSLGQRQILEDLGLPGTKAMVKILRKIEPQSVHGESWPRLAAALTRDVTGGDAAKHLAHVSTINAGVLELLLDANLARCVTPSLLDEVAADKRERYRAGVATMIADTIAMQEELSEGPTVFRQKFKSAARLREVHDETAKLFAQLQEYKRHHEFPPPPLKGIAGKIIPLTTAKKLMYEGRVQSNCVASYADRVKSGRTYIYRITHPERATLSIVRGPSGEWQIGELEVSHNRAAASGTVAYVESWLGRFRVGV